MPKSFLVQKFAKLPLGGFHVIGYSVAGEESVVQVPELDVCFDIGRGPHFALTSNILCITHGHMDHIAGLAYYLSQRHFQGMQPGTVLVPRDLANPIDAMLRCWRTVERQGTPYRLVGLDPGEDFVVRKDFTIRALQTHHGTSSLGYALLSVREKLKAEYLGKPGPEIAALRKKGEDVLYRVEVPLVTYLGDTAAGPVFETPEVINAQILITECTFYETGHKQRAKVGRHLHLDQFVDILPQLKNAEIVITHVSRRTGIRKARALLRQRIDAARLEHIHFLMDFEGADEAGDVFEAGPPLPEEAAE